MGFDLLSDSMFHCHIFRLSTSLMANLYVHPTENSEQTKIKPPLGGNVVKTE